LTIYIHFTDAPSKKLYNVQSVIEAGYRSVYVRSLFGEPTKHTDVRSVSIEPDTDQTNQEGENQ
jgi:hypothetical protein